MAFAVATAHLHSQMEAIFAPTSTDFDAVLGPTRSPFDDLISNLISPVKYQPPQGESLFHLCRRVHPDSLSLKLIHSITCSSDLDVRAMSAILLGDLFTDGGKSFICYVLTSSTLFEIKSSLLDSLTTEKSKFVSKNICNTLSQLASIVLPTDDWPELGVFILRCVNPDNSNQREIGFLIFAQLVHHLGEALILYVDTLHYVFIKSLGSGVELNVRIAALGAYVNFIRCLDDENVRDKFGDLLPLMIGTLTDGLSSGQEESTQEVLMMLIELAGVEPRFFMEQTAEVVDLMLEIAEEGSFDEGTRRLAVEFVITLAEAKEAVPKMMREFPYIIITRVFEFLMLKLLDIDEEPNWHVAVIEDEDASETATCIFEKEDGLNRLAMSLDGHTFVAVALNMLPNYFAAPEEEWQKRHAAVVVLAQIAEGYTEVMSKNLEPIMSMVSNSFQDLHPHVRLAALDAIDQLSRDFGPELQIKYHHLVLPALAAAMDDYQIPQVQARSVALFHKLLTQDGGSFLYYALTPPDQSTLWSSLVVSLTPETSNSVIKDIYDTASELTSIILLRKWSEILPFIFQCVNSGNSNLQEIGFLFFAQLAQSNGGGTLTPYLGCLYSVFVKSLGTKVKLNVRNAALQALVHAIDCLEKQGERGKFRDLLPLIMSTLTDALSSKQEVSAHKTLEMLIKLASIEPEFFVKEIVEVVGSMLQIAKTGSSDEQTRHQALAFVIMLVKHGWWPHLTKRKIPHFITEVFEILMQMFLDIEYEHGGWTANLFFGPFLQERLWFWSGEGNIFCFASEMLQGYLADPQWQRRYEALRVHNQIARILSEASKQSISGTCAIM